MTFILIRRFGAALLRAFDALCYQYEHTPAWTEKLYLSCDVGHDRGDD